MGANGTLEIESEVQLTIDADELSTYVGDQFIIGSDDEQERSLGYLAGLSFDYIDDGNADTVDVLMEYIRNERTLRGLDNEQITAIERMLRDGYDSQ